MSIRDALIQHWDRWLAPLLALLAIGAVAWPAYQDYASRKDIAAIVLPFHNMAQQSMQAACSDGTFTAKQTSADFGIRPIEGTSEIEITRRGPVSVRLSAQIGRYGTLGFDYSCAPGKPFAFHVLPSSTVPSKYLPVSLRP